MTQVSVIPDRYTRDIFDSSRYRGLQATPGPGACIEVCTNGLALDLSGVVLDGEGAGGVGVWVHDCSDVTILNGMVVGFHYGIQSENVSNLTIRGCVVSDNANTPDAGWLPDTEGPMEEGFGGGIYLHRARNCVVENNQTNNNFNGISLVRSEGNVIRGNNASYCGNVGIYLLKSSHNEVLDNLAEHCIRYTGRFWCDTADSAGDSPGGRVRPQPDQRQLPALQRRRVLHPGEQPGALQPQPGLRERRQPFAEQRLRGGVLLGERLREQHRQLFQLRVLAGVFDRHHSQGERNQGLPLRRNRHRARAGRPH